MFERFTDEARSVVLRAQHEARALRADRIEPVHLLLAVAVGTGPGSAALAAEGVTPARLWPAAARSGDPLDPDALAALGVDLGEVRAAVEATFGPGALDQGSSGPGHLPFTGSSRRVLEESLRHALCHQVRRRHRRIDEGAVLAGVLAVGDPSVDRILRELGADPDGLRGRLDREGPRADGSVGRRRRLGARSRRRRAER